MSKFISFRLKAYSEPEIRPIEAKAKAAGPSRDAPAA
jgi:hypothetical protein